MKIKRTKKTPKIQYGIEITKPHSKEMYDHNDMVAKEMKSNILNAWKECLAKLEDDDKWIMDRDWDEDDLKRDCPRIVKLQRGVCYSGYGHGYTVQDVNDEFEKELDTMANWQLHEEYSYMSFESVLPRTSFMMVGHGWSKHEYDGRFASNGEMTSPVLDEVESIELDIEKCPIPGIDAIGVNIIKNKK